MNYSINEIANGIAKYMDNELMTKLPNNSVQKVLTGVGLSLFLKQMMTKADDILKSPAVKMLGIVDDNGNIDLETLRNEILKQLPEGGMKTDIPMLGKVTFTDKDINQLYNIIALEKGTNSYEVQ